MRERRKSGKVYVPTSTRRVDTCAAEFEATMTPYLYSTYGEEDR